MNVPVKLAVFGLGLVLTLGAAVGVGRVIGPLGADSAASERAAEGKDAAGGEQSGGGHGHGGGDGGGEGSGHDSGSGAHAVPAGLQVAQNGYTLVPGDAPAEPGERSRLSFQILGPDGTPVRDFAVEHEKRLHLILVARDSSGFQHVHPDMADDGTWSVPVEFADAGPHRMFADFRPEGEDEGLTLGADVTVPGDYRPEPLPEPSRAAEVDGYRVELEGGLAPGRSSELTLTVHKDGEPVTDLQPYLGAYGHLVALRAGDLGYLHVHPDGEPGDGTTEPGPRITFFAEVPSTGTYRMYLDFKHDGKVRTAEFTVPTKGAPKSPSGDDDHGGPDHGH